jgi:prepilin-type N-terminal cleavage/methylation domain-containing protein
VTIKVSSLLKKEKGFTLIEIVLVLAIAGLILVIVFLALSGAQKSRRDTQRKTDIGRVAAQLEQYASNNNGDYPTTAALLGNFVAAYITPNATDYQDPSTGAQYTIAYSNGNAPATGTMDYMNGDDCNGATMQAGGGARSYALVISLEGGGTACRSNQ